MKKLRITQVRSAIRRLQNQKDTIRSLGIRRLNQTVEHDDTPAIRGMIHRVSHLVRVEEAVEAKPPKAARKAEPAAPETKREAGETDAAAE